jgi:hypothetical protein
LTAAGAYRRPLRLIELPLCHSFGRGNRFAGGGGGHARRWFATAGWRRPAATLLWRQCGSS